ncbi:MAG: hypothetical protein PHH28_08950 [Desulfuromonadaceae bacterium]|nr:hypothetical protein [Desulfuromonadaceae bacterium]
MQNIAAVPEETVSQFITFEVGKPFYKKNPNPLKAEGPVIQVVESSMDIYCWCNGITSKEANAWRRGWLEYGVFVNKSIPFFLLNYPEAKMGFDASLNIWAEKEAGHDYATFLTIPGNMINLFLIENSTNILKAMRMIGATYEIMDTIKETCARQLDTYADAREVTAAIGTTTRCFSTADMLKLGRTVDMIRPTAIINIRSNSQAPKGES